ncbi:hypothetical protein KC356_g109 [Hortaea werneckii]|nr:hypothetical protein KC356_g109 [Hortaea werneckii]
MFANLRDSSIASESVSTAARCGQGAPDPVALLKTKPMGCPLAVFKSALMSGRTKRTGTRYKIPVKAAAATDMTIALGTSRAGF